VIDVLTGWRNVVRVAAIDCADERNTPACRNYQVMRYPTVRLFPPGLNSSKFTGVDIPTPSSLKNTEMRRKIADFVEEVRDKYSASHFPELTQLSDNAGEEI
jgi:thiol oxidase